METSLGLDLISHRELAWGLPSGPIMFIFLLFPIALSYPGGRSEHSGGRNIRSRLPDASPSRPKMVAEAALLCDKPIVPAHNGVSLAKALNLSN
jgi:hypothetical protein